MKISLWEGTPPGFVEGKIEEVPLLTVYPATVNPSGSAMLICPGGGYHHRAQHEGEPVAQWLNQLGVTAFVLDYRVAPARYPCQLLDGQRALRYIRALAGQWEIQPDKVGVLGFSAGGHLAATLGTSFDDGNSEADDPIERQSCRPDLMVLCYPVITFGQYRHQGSVENLLGAEPGTNLLREHSLELKVMEDTPPVFLWHTANDASVPVENALLFSGALSQKRVSFELHIFPEGRHGLGLAPDNPEVAVWKALCEAWLGKMNFIK